MVLKGLPRRMCTGVLPLHTEAADRGSGLCCFPLKPGWHVPCCVGLCRRAAIHLHVCAHLCLPFRRGLSQGVGASQVPQEDLAFARPVDRVPGPGLPVRGWAHEPTELHLPLALPPELSPPSPPVRGECPATESVDRRALGSSHPLSRLLLQAPPPARLGSRAPVRPPSLFHERSAASRARGHG